jgi:hypothetical protein
MIALCRAISAKGHSVGPKAEVLHLRAGSAIRRGSPSAFKAELSVLFQASGGTVRSRWEAELMTYSLASDGRRPEEP